MTIMENNVPADQDRKLLPLNTLVEYILNLLQDISVEEFSEEGRQSFLNTVSTAISERGPDWLAAEFSDPASMTLDVLERALTGNRLDGLVQWAAVLLAHGTISLDPKKVLVLASRTGCQALVGWASRAANCPANYELLGDAICEASEHGYLSIVQTLVKTQFCSSYSCLQLALYTAVNGEHFPVVQALLDPGNCFFRDRGNPASWVVSLYSGPALHAASGHGYVDIVQALIGAGADVHEGNDQALRAAVDQGHPVVVQALVDAGADVGVWDDYPLRGACIDGNMDIVRILIGTGTITRSAAKYELASAAKHGHLDVVRALVGVGINVDAYLLDRLERIPDAIFAAQLGSG